VLKAWTQVAHTQNSPPNTRILHKWLGSHKEWLGRAQEVVERLCKWSGTSKPREKGWSAFYRKLKKLAVRAVRANRSTIPVRPVGWLQASSGHSLKETLRIDNFGLGPGHVRRRARQVRWSSNLNDHIVHRTCLVQDQTCLENLSRIRWRDRTSLVDQTGSRIGPTSMTGIQNWSNR
jgi:hypothetical protein